MQDRAQLAQNQTPGRADPTGGGGQKAPRNRAREEVHLHTRPPLAARILTFFQPPKPSKAGEQTKNTMVGLVTHTQSKHCLGFLHLVSLSVSPAPDLSTRACRPPRVRSQLEARTPPRVFAHRRSIRPPSPIASSDALKSVAILPHRVCLRKEEPRRMPQLPVPIRLRMCAPPV